MAVGFRVTCGSSGRGPDEERGRAQDIDQGRHLSCQGAERAPNYSEGWYQQEVARNSGEELDRRLTCHVKGSV